MTKLALILIPALPLAACSNGNDRPWVGNPDLPGGAVYLDALKPSPRPETHKGPDAPTLQDLDRTNWSTTTMTVPVDSTAATRTYAVNYMWATSTARQRGQMPTPISCLELSGDSYWDQVGETVVSPIFAFGSGVLLLPRMITHSPTREVRSFPQSYWRSPIDIPHAPPAQPAAQPAPADAPAH